MRVAVNIQLTDTQRKLLEAWARGRAAQARWQQRARIVLAAAEGKQNKQIADELKVDRSIVARWRQRFAALGVPGIEKDAPGRGRPGNQALISKVIQMTTQQKPANATHWSTNSMAKAAGTSAATVQRIWAAAGLKPHLAKSFKLPNDPKFEEKLVDIVGLYVNPPENVLVLSCDEKSQIQALDRTQPMLPLSAGHAATQTHDYVRNGTTTLFAALNTLTGTVIGTCMKQHRHQEWIKFLKLIDAQTPPDKELHLIIDNYSTHKHAKVKAWLKRHPRFHIHFTPTSASWLNMVERFFRDITVNQIRRGAFASVGQLVAAIEAHVALHNQSPKPFIWTAKADDILAKVNRAKAILNKLQTM